MSGSPGTLAFLSSASMPLVPRGPEIRFFSEVCSPQSGYTFKPKNASRIAPAAPMATQKPFCFSLSTWISLFLLGALVGRRLGLAVLFAHGELQLHLIPPVLLLGGLRRPVLAALDERRVLGHRPGEL